MDTLTFGTPRLLRHLTFSEARKEPISEINLEAVLRQLGMSMSAFIDMCILLGCDYCDSIRGIGPGRAYTLMKQHGSLEKVLANLDETKYPRPEIFPWKESHAMFEKPDVTDPNEIELTWNKPDEEGLVQFLCKEMNFAEDRVRNGVKKINAARSSGTQSRIEGFFTKKRKVCRTTYCVFLFQAIEAVADSAVAN